MGSGGDFESIMGLQTPLWSFECPSFEAETKEDRKASYWKYIIQARNVIRTKLREKGIAGSTQGSVAQGTKSSNYAKQPKGGWENSSLCGQWLKLFASLPRLDFHISVFLNFGSLVFWLWHSLTEPQGQLILLPDSDTSALAPRRDPRGWSPVR